jgi:hypothetical protein
MAAAFSSGVPGPLDSTSNDDNGNRAQQGRQQQDFPMKSVLQLILENQRKFRQEQSHSSSDQVSQSTAAQSLPTKPAPRKGESLFDVFPVPKKVERKPNAFPEQSFVAYEAIIQNMLQQPDFRKLQTKKAIPEDVSRPVADWLLSDVPMATIDLPSFNNALQGGRQLDLSSDRSVVALDDVKAQKERFMKEMDFDKKQYTMMSGALFKMANMLAKHGNGQPMSVLWQKIKEAGIFEKDMLHNVLYVAATFPSGSCSRAKRLSKYGHLAGLVSILDVLDTPGSDGWTDDSSSGDDAVDLVDEIAIYHDLIHVPTEQSINIRIRLLVSQGKAQEADALVREQSMATEGLHLRVFRPVLRLHLEMGDSASALNLFGRMMELPSVIIDVETYMYLLNGLAKNGNFRPDSEPLKGIADAGFSSTGGPELFNEVTTFMSNEIIDIPDNLAKLFRTALAECFPEFIDDDSSPLAPLPLATAKNSNAALFADRVKISNESGLCPLSGVKLHLTQITEDERRDLMDRLLRLSTVSHDSYVQGRKLTGSMHPNSAGENMKGFYTWLDERKGTPFTTIVDGANIGYYQQNFEHGRFSYHQIKFVVDSLQRLGENPLVILPLKYSRHTFLISDTAAGSKQGFRQVLTKEELSIQQSLMEQDCVYFVPSTFLDDLYWILASISLQTKSRQGRDLTVAPNDASGRWPGVRPILITNDQMRDHQVEMLGPMLFRRWYSNCIVNFNFFPFVNGRQTNNSIGFCPADFFSREIQRNTDASGATVWHFPLKDKENEWFCVKLPPATT